MDSLRNIVDGKKKEDKGIGILEKIGIGIKLWLELRGKIILSLSKKVIIGIHYNCFMVGTYVC